MMRRFAPIAFVLCLAFPGSTLADDPPTADAAGHWQGQVEIPGQPLGVNIHLEAADDGWRGTIDIPAQGARNIPLGGVAVEGSAVRFAIAGVPGNPTFEGTVAGDGVTGTFSQGGATFPFTLERSAAAPEPLKRPQTPTPPFPYTVEEVTFGHGDVTLAGTLTLPKGDGPFPGAVLVSGSGPQDRDETLFDHKPFLVIADHLTRAGIAVLRYDDRGIGESGGDFATATSADFADDALAAVHFLADRAETDPTGVGIIGHSEGGLVGPMAAASEAGGDRVAFVVMMAGLGVSGAEILPAQTAAIAKANGANPMAATAQAAALSRAIEVVVGSASVEEARATLWQQAEEQIQAMRPADAPQGLNEQERAAIQAQIDGITTPWSVFFLKFDPATALEKVKVPVLAINGSLDTQVLPEQHLPVIENVLTEAGNEQVTVKTFEGLNHLFQNAESGSPMEYAEIEETLAPEVLETITEWILALRR